ncbi:hypothetical protein AB4865_01620 [Capnocytophaga sp. ARDL2]|uniref:hypothetical protein n=1 Tax=Capnocytophaga sp. ARDL2 TaxID=3238809 RepID=UPI003556EC46
MSNVGATAQTYCTSSFELGCTEDYIGVFSIPSANFTHDSDGCFDGAYGDFTPQTITL